MQFDWDGGNRDKNLRHGVHDWEIEEALEDPGRLEIDRSVAHGELRVTVLARSRTSGKYLRIVYTERTHGSRQLTRPISAVVMSRRHRRQYRRQS